MNLPSMIRLALVCLALLLSGWPAGAIGLGVSPPRLDLNDGMGRLMIFNPGDVPVRFSVAVDGVFSVRPSSGLIKPHGSASVLVSGEGDGFARLLAEPDGDADVPVAMPGIDVSLHANPVSSDVPSLVLPVLAGVAGALVLVVSGILVFLLIKSKTNAGRRARIGQPSSLEGAGQARVDGNGRHQGY